jgi:hypothetical protein
LRLTASDFLRGSCAGSCDVALQVSRLLHTVQPFENPFLASQAPGFIFSGATSSRVRVAWISKPCTRRLDSLNPLVGGRNRWELRRSSEARLQRRGIIGGRKGRRRCQSPLGLGKERVKQKANSARCISSILNSLDIFGLDSQLYAAVNPTAKQMDKRGKITWQPAAHNIAMSG